MLTPRQEPTLTNVKKPPRTTLFDGIPVRHSLDDRTRWTGLPSVMGTLERWMFRTPADAAALVALSRTRVHPDPGVATRLKGAF